MIRSMAEAESEIRAKKSVKKKVDGRENSLKIKVPPMATIVFKWAK